MSLSMQVFSFLSVFPDRFRASAVVVYGSSEELMRVAINIDWRIIGQTSLFFTGAGLDTHGRPVELFEIRDGSDR